MSKVKITVLLLIFLSSASPSFSQDSSQTKKVWTLEECIEYAKKNSLDIRRAILTRESNRVTYTQSIAGLLPSVNASTSNNYNFGRFRVENTDLVITQKAQNINMGINGNINLFSGFQVQNTIKQNKLFLESSIADIEQTENNISISVASAYLDIVFNKELLEAAIIQLKSSEEQLARTEKLVAAGALAEVSSLDLRAQAATAELNIVNAENALALSKLTLMQFLLLSSESEFDVVIPKSPEVEPVELQISSSELYKISLTTQPSIKSSELYIQSAKYGERAANSSRYPSLGIYGQYGSSYRREEIDKTRFNISDFRQQAKDNISKNFGIQLSIPIFNNWQVRRQIQNSIIFSKRAELNQVEVKNTLRQNVEQAHLNAKLAIKRYFSTKKQVENLRESFRVNEQRFNVGAVNSLDFTIAKNNLNKAESDFIRAKYDYIFRLKILDFYQNKPLTLTNQ